MDNFGILTLLPPVVIIVFAIWTRRTWEALLLGSMIAFFYTAKLGVVTETINQLQATFADQAWIFMVMFMLGAFAYLLSASKGSQAFGQVIKKFCNTEKKTLLSAYVLGIIIFMDDYLNMLTVSSATLDVCDKNRTPREMLAYVMDSTGAPVCVLIPISSWAVYFTGVMDECLGNNDTWGHGLSMYVDAIPYIFYAWAAIIIVPLVIIGVIPKVGLMKKAYKRVADGGKVWPDDSAVLNEGVEEAEEEEIDKIPLRLACFFVPLGVVVFVTIYSGDMIIGLMWALISMLALYLLTGVVKFGEFCDQFAAGVAYMIPMNLIMIGALTVKVSMDSIGLADYVIGLVVPILNPSFFFAMAFIVVAALSFVTGSNWGIPAITFPILIPMALEFGISPVITMACIVSAGTFGSHICFYSDATVLASQCSKIQNLQHAFSQFPYGCIGAAAAFIGYVILGFVVC